jgi:hypothetical protein
MFPFPYSSAGKTCQLTMKAVTAYDALRLGYDGMGLAQTVSCSVTPHSRQDQIKGLRIFTAARDCYNQFAETIRTWQNSKSRPTLSMLHCMLQHSCAAACSAMAGQCCLQSAALVQNAPHTKLLPLCIRMHIYFKAQTQTSHTGPKHS